MASKPQRRDFMLHALGVVACLVVGYLGTIQGVRIPILADATYGLHALGHLVTWFLPDAYRAMMGSLFQVLLPLGFAGYFLLFQRDLLGVALMMAWTGVSANQTSVYIADAVAPSMVIGPGHVAHDWAIALAHFGRLGAADELAWIVQGAALTCVFLGMGVAAWGAIRVLFEREKVAHTESFLERRPVVGPAKYDEWMRDQGPETSAPAPPSATM